MLGFINLNGNLEIALDLQHIFDNTGGKGERVLKRMLHVGNGKLKFVFKADDIAGIINVEMNDIENLPDSVTAGSVINSRFFMHGQQVLIVDSDEFFTKIDEMLKK